MRQGPEPRTRDVTYPAADGSEQPARVDTPEGEGPFPLIVHHHGGGWVIAYIDTYDASARALSAGADLRAAFGGDAAQPATADATTGVEPTAAETPDAAATDATQMEGMAQPVEGDAATGAGN